jgi:carboxyl-terminal processing protease
MTDPGTQKRRAQTIISLLLVVCVAFPQSLSAASILAREAIITPDGSVITRAEFIRASVKILELPLIRDGDLPYERKIPSGLQTYVLTAFKRGALSIFGDELLYGRDITRGEALHVMRMLTGISPRSIQDFIDVENGSDLEAATSVAVQEDWMKPLRSTRFGVHRKLTGKEGRLFLARVVSEVPEAPQGTVTVEVPKIKIVLTPKERPKLPKSQILETVWELLNDEFLYKENINPEETAYKMAEAIVESMDDPYTTFLRPIPAKEFQVHIQGELSGIGTQVEYLNNILTVVTPLRGSPAEKAGMKPGDKILAVDGENVVGIGFMEAVDKVRGPKGSKALLRINRNGVEFDISVIRDVIRIPEIEVDMHGNVAVIRLVQFGRTTDRELRGILANLESQGIGGYILDLRNNPGGLLHAATVVLSNFLPVGSPIAKIASRGEEYLEETTEQPTVSPEKPLVVLINGGSASASEIVAGALQDYDRATILGEKSYGKGTVQQVIEFTDGSGIKLTIAEWFTPNGRKINGVGIAPDRRVEEEDDRDVQLLRALELTR